MAGILAKLQKLEIKKNPCINPILDTKGAVTHFVKPALVANFEFAELIIYPDSRPPRIRKPATFLGFREDKPAGEVVLELAKPASAWTASTNSPAVKKKRR